MIETTNIPVIDFDVFMKAVEVKLDIKYNSSGIWNSPDEDCFEVEIDDFSQQGESQWSYRGYNEHHAWHDSNLPEVPTVEEFLESYPTSDPDLETSGKSQRCIPFSMLLVFMREELPQDEFIIWHKW